MNQFRNNILKLLMYKEGKEIRTILKPNTDESLREISDTAEKWKKKDIKKRTQ